MADVVNDFSSPTKMNNVVLVVEGKKLHVSKEYLSVHSPVFETIFFGENSGNDTKELEIKDVVYEEFLDLLRYIYHDTHAITDHSVVHILKLSHKFQLERIIDHCEMHITQSKGFTDMKKLQIADQFRLVTLRDQCLQSFTSATDLVGQLGSPEFDDFSNELKAGICTRISLLRRLPSTPRLN